MSAALFAHQPQLDEIERTRVDAKLRHDQGDTTALPEYHETLRRILGATQAQMIIDGKAHLRPIIGHDPEPHNPDEQPVAKFKKGDRLRVIGDKQPPQIGTVETVTQPVRYKSRTTSAWVPASYALKMENGQVYGGYGENWLTPADNPNAY